MQESMSKRCLRITMTVNGGHLTVKLWEILRNGDPIQRCAAPILHTSSIKQEMQENEQDEC